MRDCQECNPGAPRPKGQPVMCGECIRRINQGEAAVQLRLDEKEPKRRLAWLRPRKDVA